MWNNPSLEHLKMSLDSVSWRKKGINNIIKQIYDHKDLQTFEFLSQQYDIPHKFFYKYLQLRYMIQAQFEYQHPKLSKYPLICILRSQGPKSFNICFNKNC